MKTGILGGAAIAALIGGTLFALVPSLASTPSSPAERAATAELNRNIAVRNAAADEQAVARGQAGVVGIRPCPVRESRSRHGRRALVKVERRRDEVVGWYRRHVSERQPGMMRLLERHDGLVQCRLRRFLHQQREMRKHRVIERRQLLHLDGERHSQANLRHSTGGL